MKISCVITLFNDEKFIVRCLNSILSQTYKNFEIIIINDGSTDNSLSICQKIEDSRIKIISQENCGVCKARNRGIEESNGDYCLFIDSDDFFNDTNMFKILVDTANKYNNPDLITFDYVRYYSDETTYNEFKDDGHIEIYNNYDACREYLNGNNKFSMVLWRRLYKKSIFKSIYFEDKILPEDLFTAFDIYSKSERIVHISKSFYSYYIKDDGLTIQNRQKDIINLLYITKVLFNKEISFFKNDRCMIKRIKTIYYNYLLTMYGRLYNSESSNIKKEYLIKINNLIKFDEIANVEFKTKLAMLMYFFNKKYFSNIIYNQYIKDVKER